MGLRHSLVINFFFFLVVPALAELQPFYKQCTQHCPLQNRTGDGHMEIGCGPECEISQCLMGCALWEKALEASCKTVCNGTQELLPPKELFCVMGCNDALNRYLQQLKDVYGVPPAPALVADSLTSTSLRLEWESQGYSNLTWLAQWRYEPSGSWEYAREQEWGPGPTVLISGLTPYTNYRFRIVVLSQEAELVSSEASLVIGTLPGGPPTSPPSQLRATPTGPTRVSITWSPGMFPNGPLLSYALMIEELPTGYRAHKDIPASEMKHFYMFQSLSPSRNYSVSVAMRNAAGLGPSATAIVTTPNLSEVKEKEKTTLILGTHHAVLSQNADMLDDPVELYSTDEHIRGVAYHVRKGIIFVSDSRGRVLSVKDHESKVILATELTPHSLSVDWLNDQLYVLGQSGSWWEVARCQLDGTGIIVAVAGLTSKPLHIHVDPYNGYLFWLVQGVPGGGLYRLDLSEISNGIKHETSPDLILNDPNLGAFTVDYTNFRILVSSHEKNTVLAVSLDGKETTNIRTNTAQPQFKHVTSLAMANGLFYWTNGHEILTEEYHPGKDNYFHNVGGQSEGYVSIGVDSESAQPTPVPVNPPTCLQAVLGAGHATAAWAPPHLLGGQGKGAWQDWSYRLSIEWEGDNMTLDYINTTQVTVNGLQSDELIKLRVAAVTDAGLGPWSAAFTGRTLSSTSPSLLWSASQGVLKSDPTGENLINLLHRQHFQDSRGRQHVTDIAWFEDVLYLVTNTSQVFLFNTTSKSHSKLRGIEVGSIAVDWIGKRLYWSNPKQQLITRGHLNGSHQEPLPILTVAKELNIDAINAFIYWSTGHAVECARLNGKQKRTYYPAELFSGKQVMGLTLDMHKKSVYWIVRNYEGSTLFRAPMADNLQPTQEITPVKMALTQYPDIQGPLCYFDSRLLWLRDDRNAVIGDLNGTNSALLNSMSLTGLNMVTVVDSSLHPLPDLEGEEVNVIPELIPIDSLHVIGNFSHFNITWDPIRNVNLGQVFYELKISHDDKKEITIETIHPTWQYPLEEALPPYTELRVSIKALTFWGSSARQSTVLHSPESVPTQPLSLRAFVTFVPIDTSGFVKEREVILRWEIPSSPNGILSGYKIVSWIDGSSSYLWVTPVQQINSLEYRTRDIPRDSILFFQVRACTKVGCGLPSSAVRVETGRETPLPLLLMSTEDGASLGDVDRGDARLLASHQGVISLAYVGSNVFYLDNRGTINLATDRGEAKVVSLNNTGMAIATDWVGRFLYWSEKGEKQGTSLIKRLDLSLFDHGVIEVKNIAERPNLALHLQTDPNNRMLYWIEEKPNKFAYLMKCSVDDCEEPSFFFGQTNEQKDCNCPKSPIPWSVFYLDTIQPKLFWIDAATGSLFIADLEACHCHIILDNYIGRNTGLPPTSLTVDLQHIYWSNETENRLYMISKSTFHHFDNVSSQEVPRLQKIQAYGPHLQPLPDLECLIPHSEQNNQPELAFQTSDSLTLDLGESTRPEKCHKLSQISSIFTVYYGAIEPDGRCPCAEHLASCHNMTAYNNKPKITGLLPYTSYIVRIVESNYYLDMIEITPKISVPFIFRTAPGAPSPPEDVSGMPLSPTVAEIKWEPPRLVNSWRLVRYEVVWRSSGLADGVRQNGEQVVETKGNTNETVSVRLQKLIPGQTYNISVRAYSEDSEIFSQSCCIYLTTFFEPPDLILLKATPYSLNISWPADMNISTHSHEMEYMDVASGEYWQPVPLSSFDDEDEIYYLDNLKPKTMYSFRMRIVYVDLEPEEEYIWPLDNRFTFRTLGDRPSQPGRPVMQHLSSGTYQVAWEPSKDNGAPILAYVLEGKQAHPNKRGTNSSLAEDEKWNIYYNGTNSYWKMSKDMKGEKYRFRVRAFNSYGWSDYSDSSSFDLSQTGARLVDSHDVTIVLWVLTPTAIFITLLLFVCVLYRTQVNSKKVPVRADTELATLRELPRWSVQNTNALYSGSSPHPLPRLRRDQITLTKFLGSGAFGEVFEGLAISIMGSEGPTRVAIKTLRKGANGQEKAEFLKEAQLMSNFRHPHILQLLGVCLDNDPHFIIMELMEGGDLLSYLRSSRPLMRAWDLLAMCVDVARGCCYLEEMHFVHRDLACRNCLVSSRDPATRVVKIGDFGLARDIYKNDYYRKEGEGLLPVRWMAPESLVDGVFTSQSDVWAFGVLLWEILTLGQQPYPARNNLEVLHYVRGGGRLTQPTAASAEMYALMMKCWSFNPDERPTFKYCLEVLVELKEKIPNIITPRMPEIVPIQEKREEGTPKYLELVYEDEGGYEVPRSLEQTPEDDKSSLEKLLPGYTNLSSGEVSPTR